MNGKEALIALANGEDVEYIRSTINDGWLNAKKLSIDEIINHVRIIGNDSWSIRFRIKPKTANVNGFELPVPFEPKVGESYYAPASNTTCINNNGSHFDKEIIARGVYRTADEAEVVAKLLPRILRGERVDG